MGPRGLAMHGPFTVPLPASTTYKAPSGPQARPRGLSRLLMTTETDAAARDSSCFADAVVGTLVGSIAVGASAQAAKMAIVARGSVRLRRIRCSIEAETCPVKRQMDIEAL